MISFFCQNRMLNIRSWKFPSRAKNREAKPSVAYLSHFLCNSEAKSRIPASPLPKQCSANLFIHFEESMHTITNGIPTKIVTKTINEANNAPISNRLSRPAQVMITMNALLFQTWYQWQIATSSHLALPFHSLLKTKPAPDRKNHHFWQWTHIILSTGRYL